MTVYSGDRNHHNHIGKAAKNRNHPVSPQPSAIVVCAGIQIWGGRPSCLSQGSMIKSEKRRAQRKEGILPPKED